MSYSLKHVYYCVVSFGNLLSYSLIVSYCLASLRRQVNCLTAWLAWSIPLVLLSYSLASLRRQERFKKKNNDEIVTLPNITPSYDILCSSIGARKYFNIGTSDNELMGLCHT